MAASLPTILNWFLTGKKPTQEQFWQSWQSFWHKDELIPMAKIQSLVSTLTGKADKTQFDAHAADLDAHNLNERLEQKAELEHTHSIDDVGGLADALANVTVSDATTDEKGIIQLAGDLAGPASAPTVPGKVNKGANPEYEYLADTSDKYGVALWSRIGAMFRSPSLLWDETLKQLTIAGTQAVWEAYPLVTDGNMGIKALNAAVEAFKIFDDFGNYFSVGTVGGKRLTRVFTAFRLMAGSSYNEAEFIAVDCLAAESSHLLKSISLPTNAILTVSVAGIGIYNTDKDHIKGTAQFTFKNDGGTVTDLSHDDFRYKQWSTIKATDGYVTNADSRIDAAISGTTVNINFYNVSPARLTTIQCRLDYNITPLPEA